MSRIRILASALALAGATVPGCGEDPAGPSSASTIIPLNASAQERGQLHSALLFAREHVLALRPDAAAPITVALATLTQGIERNDRMSVDRSTADAVAAIHRYRRVVGGSDADPDLEALSFSLDRVGAVAHGSDKAAASASLRTSTSQERRP
jgi:hypothetical protein